MVLITQAAQSADNPLGMKRPKRKRFWAASRARRRRTNKNREMLIFLSGEEEMSTQKANTRVGIAVAC